jgi:uncharacterized protein YcbK (DUF882 family)
VSLPDGRHFKYTDAACHDGTPYPEEWPDRWALVLALADAVRDAWGASLGAVSWYRSPAHNAALIVADAGNGAHGVASASQHVEGNAVDLRPIGGGDASQLYRVVLAAYERGVLSMLGGVGFYPISNWVHVDTLKPADGHLRRWIGT